MRGRRWIAILLMASILQSFSLAAMGEANTEVMKNSPEAGWDGISLDDAGISINGVPMGDVIGTASGMFADAVSENVSEAIGGLNDIFSQFAEDFSTDLAEIGDTVESMIEDTWLVKIPAISFDAMIKRSVYDNALDLYEAQISGASDRDVRIARDTAEGCGNNIIYIYDEGAAIAAILESVENGTFGEREIVFGLEGYYGTFAVSAVLFLTPSDDPLAMCNMADLTDERQFNAYRDYAVAHAVKTYDEEISYGDPLVTLIFWNQNEGDDWLAVVAKEIPMMLN